MGGLWEHMPPFFRIWFAFCLAIIVAGWIVVAVGFYYLADRGPAGVAHDLGALVGEFNRGMSGR